MTAAPSPGRPRVSIVMPTYNRAGGFLEQAIESVLGQDYPNLELTVLDDGSTDGTPAVLESYGRRHPGRFNSVRHDNVGMLRTINRGFELAEGELTGFVMSDDLLLPGAIEAFVSALEADPEAVAVFCAWEAVDEDGELQDTITPLEFSRPDGVRLAYSNVGAGSLVRREVLEAVGLLDPGFANMWDFDLWFRVAKAGTVIRLSEPLSAFRSHAGQAGTSRRGTALAKERLALFDKIYADPEREPELDEVRPEALRNSLLGAALVARGFLNDDSDRFFIEDRLYRRIADRAGRFDFEQDAALMLDRIHRLQAELKGCEAEIGYLGRTLAEREQVLAELRSRADGGTST